MLEVHSPLGAEARFEREGVLLSEAAGFTLTQVAGEDKILKKALGKLPAKIGVALECDGHTLLRVAPKQFWVLGLTLAPSDGVYVSPLSSSRTRIALEGTRARAILASCALIDFDQKQFQPNQFVLTGIHHTPVIIHCIKNNSFHIYALRTYAQNMWEWLCDVVEGLDHA